MKRKLIRNLAVMMTAVVMLGSVPPVQPVIAAEITASAEPEAAVQSAAETAAASPALQEAQLILQDAELMYGTKEEELNAMLSPALEGVGNPSFTVTYKIFRDQKAAEAVTEENFDRHPGDPLETINAGTTVTIAALAEVESEDGGTYPVLAKKNYRIEKRKLYLTLQPDSVSVSEKDKIDSGRLTLSPEDKEFASVLLCMEPPTGQQMDAAGGPDPADALKGGVTLDLSGVDMESYGRREVPAEAELSPEFEKNFVIDNKYSRAYVNVIKAEYYIVLTGRNNGETKIYTWKNTLAKGSSQTISEFLRAQKDVPSDLLTTFGGLADTAAGDELEGFRTGAGNNYAENEYYDRESFGSGFMIYGRSDYDLTAIISKRAAEYLSVSGLTNVYYDGRAHVAEYVAGTAQKSKAYTLYPTVYYYDTAESAEGIYVPSQYYTITYKNNVQPSMKWDEEEKQYVPLYTSNDKRPSITVKGKGKYAGFSATAYFEILPLDIGRYLYQGSGVYPAEISGISHVYALNEKGALLKKISPKVTRKIGYYNKKYEYQKIAMKEDVDYTVRLFRYDEAKNCWTLLDFSDPNGITSTGDYLYTIWGKGKYGGGVYTDEMYSPEEFCDGTTGEIFPKHSSYSGTDYTACQFRVMTDAYADLANAKLTVKHPTVKWSSSHDYYYDGSDFGITVTIGSGKNATNLVEGRDYYISYKGADYDYIKYNSTYGYYNTYSANTTYCTEGGVSQVYLANRYDFTIYAMGDTYFGYQKGKTLRLKGIKINSGMLKYTKSYNYSPSEIDVRVYTNRRAKNGVSIVSGTNDYYGNEASFSYNAVKHTKQLNHGLPGKYMLTIWPVGRGVDHDYIPELPYQVKPISLQDAVKRGYVSISSIGEAEYNAGGAVPKSISLYYNGTTTDADISYNGQIFYASFKDKYGSAHSCGFAVTASNNKKSGSGALLKLTCPGGVFKGSATMDRDKKKFTFSVNPRTLSNVTIPELTDDQYLIENGKKTTYLSGLKYQEGALLAVTAEGKKGKASLDAPQVKLFQTYYKNEKDYYANRLSLAPLQAFQYRAESVDPKTENSCRVKFTSGTPDLTGFSMDEVYGEKEWQLYDEDVKIKGIRISYKGNEAELPSKEGFSAVFTGTQIRPTVTKVLLSDGTELGTESFEVTYGENVTAKSKGGSIRVKLKANASTGAFPYNGTAEFTFNIIDSPGITL